MPDAEVFLFNHEYVGYIRGHRCNIRHDVKECVLLYVPWTRIERERHATQPLGKLVRCIWEDHGAYLAHWMSQENEDSRAERGGRVSEYEVAIRGPVGRVINTAQITKGRRVRRRKDEDEPKKPDTECVHRG